MTANKQAQVDIAGTRVPQENSFSSSYCVSFLGLSEPAKIPLSVRPSIRYFQVHFMAAISPGEKKKEKSLNVTG